MCCAVACANVSCMPQLVMEVKCRAARPWMYMHAGAWEALFVVRGRGSAAVLAGHRYHDTEPEAGSPLPQQQSCSYRHRVYG